MPHAERPLPFSPPQTRNPTWAAEVVSATLKVRLRLGLLRRAIYAVRPGPLGLLALGSAALALVLGGGGAALVFLALLLWTGLGGGGREAGAGGEEQSSSSVSGAEEISSVSGISDASSSLLRELDGEREAPPSPAPAAAAAAEKVEQWWDALPGTSGGGRPGGKPAAAGPADSAMGSGSGARGLAAAMRRRTSGNRPL